MAIGTEIDRIFVAMGMDIKDYSRGVAMIVTKTRTMANKVVAQTRRMVRAFAKMGQRLKQIGTTMFARLTLPVVGLGALFVKAASDAEEMTNMFDIVFKKQAADVKRWALSMEQGTGRSRFAMMQFAAEFQDLFVPMGFARKEGAELSKMLVQLGVDVGSLKNVSDPEIFIKFQSALVGEAEAVRRLGVDLSQAALDQELLNMGIKGGVKAATQQEKVLARIALLVRQTGDAHGDAARTSESFANQLKALGAQWQLLSIEMGRVFMPIARKIVAVARSLIAEFRKLTPEVKAFVAIGAIVAAVAGPVLFSLGLMAVGISALGTAFLWLGGIVKKVVIGIGVLLGGAVGSWLALILAPIAAVIALATAFAVLQRGVTTAAKGIGKAIKEFLVIQMKEDFRILKLELENIGTFFVNLKRKIAGEAELPMNIISRKRGGFSGLGDQLVDDMKAAGDQIVEDFKITVTKLKRVAERVLDKITPDFDFGAVGADFLAIFETLKEQAAGLEDMFAGLGETGADVLADLDGLAERVSQSMQDRLGDMVRGTTSLFEGLKNIAFDILDLIAQKIIETFVVRDLFGALGLGGFFTGIGAALAGGGSSSQPFLAGERGPEFIFPKAPVVVKNAADTRSMGMGIGAGRNDVTIVNQFDTTVQPTLAAMVQNAVQQSIPLMTQSVFAALNRRGVSGT